MCIITPLMNILGSDKARKSIDHSLNLFTSNFTSNELLLIVVQTILNSLPKS